MLQVCVGFRIQDRRLYRHNDIMNDSICFRETTSYMRFIRARGPAAVVEEKRCRPRMRSFLLARILPRIMQDQPSWNYQKGSMSNFPKQTEQVKYLER